MYDPTPCTASDYDAYRVGRHITYLRCSYHLGRNTEPTISALRRGALQLPPASAAEMARDRADQLAEAPRYWRAAIDLLRGERAHMSELRSRVRVERFVGGDGAAFQAQIDEIEGRVVALWDRCRDARKLAAYLTERLAAAVPAIAAA